MRPITSAAGTLVTLALAAFVATACSSSAPPAASSQKQTKNATKDPNADGNNGPNGAPAAAPPAKGPAAAGALPSAATCGKSANIQACGDCCMGKNDVNNKVFQDAMNKCTCDQAKATCTADCAPGYCVAADGTSQAVSDTCSDSCNVDMSGCGDTAKKACDADPTCAAARKCYEDAKCDSLPDDLSGTSGTSGDSSSSDSSSSDSSPTGN